MPALRYRARMPSRATDEIGQVQPTREEVAKFMGVAYTPSFRPPMNNNTIMPWKIARDGSVTNGLPPVEGA